MLNLPTLVDLPEGVNVVPHHTVIDRGQKVLPQTESTNLIHEGFTSYLNTSKKSLFKNHGIPITNAELLSFNFKFGESIKG
jgi:hypothetical protein